MAFQPSLRRLDLPEGWVINTYHLPAEAAMKAVLTYRDGRQFSLILWDDEMLGDLSRAQQRLLDWVVMTTAMTTVDVPNRQINLDD